MSHRSDFKDDNEDYRPRVIASKRGIIIPWAMLGLAICGAGDHFIYLSPTQADHAKKLEQHDKQLDDMRVELSRDEQDIAFLKANYATEIESMRQIQAELRQIHYFLMGGEEINHVTKSSHVDP